MTVRWMILTVLLTVLVVASAELPLQQRRRWLQDHVLGPSVQIVVPERSVGPLGGWMAAGSGTVFKRNGKTYILTAAHVVEHAQETLNDEVDGAAQRKKVRFRDVWVVLERLKDGRKTGEVRLLAKVRFATKTEEEGGDDVAVLEVYDGDLLAHSAVPLDDESKLWIGQTVWHVGSLVGEFVNSLMKGNLAAIGRIYEDKVFHQITAPGKPGSSGGGVFVECEDGIYYAGMLTRGLRNSDTVNFVVPLARLRDALQHAEDENIKNLLTVSASARR